MRRELEPFFFDPNLATVDSPWIFWPRAPDARLLDSLRRMGQIQPVLAERDGLYATVISGRRRVLALRELGEPVLGMRVWANPLEKGLLYLDANADRCPEIGAGRRVAALRYFNGLVAAGEIDSGDIEAEVAPRLGSRASSREWRRLCLWLELPPRLDAHLEAERMPLDVVEALTAMTEAEADAVAVFFADMSWSRNNARRFCEDLLETARRRGIGVDDLTAELDLASELTPGLSPKDAAARLLARTRDARRPRLRRMEAAFKDAAGRLTQGGPWRVERADAFETDTVTVAARVNGPEALLDAASALARMADAAECGELFAPAGSGDEKNDAGAIADVNALKDLGA